MEGGGEGQINTYLNELLAQAQGFKATRHLLLPVYGGSEW